jgi:hypothetical protein
MRYDVSELTIPPKFAGLSGNVLLIYLILYMRSGRTALLLVIITFIAYLRRPRLVTDHVVMFGMVLVSS